MREEYTLEERCKFCVARLLQKPILDRLPKDEIKEEISRQENELNRLEEEEAEYCRFYSMLHRILKKRILAQYPDSNLDSKLEELAECRIQRERIYKQYKGQNPDLVLAALEKSRDKAKEEMAFRQTVTDRDLATYSRDVPRSNRIVLLMPKKKGTWKTISFEKFARHLRIIRRKKRIAKAAIDQLEQRARES